MDRLKDFAAALPSLVLGQAANWPCSVQRLQFSPNPPPNRYPSTCWMVQRLTSSCLASSRWLTPFDRSTRMYSRCCSLRLGRRPARSAPALPPTKNFRRAAPRAGLGRLHCRAQEL